MDIFKPKIRGEVKMHMGGCGSCRSCFGNEEEETNEKKKKEEKKEDE